VYSENGGKIMATKKNDDDIVKEVVKKKPRGKNIGETLAPITEPGDNAKYIGVSLQLFNMTKVDLYNPDEVQERLTEYFRIHTKADMKPTVVGMAMALGIDRRRLWEIRSGAMIGGHTPIDLPTLTVDYIKKAYDFMENLWENYMQNGKINPVSGIFLGKNNFGYQDKTEYVVTPNVNNDSDYNKEDIMARYAIDSPDSSTLEQLPDSTDSAD
jgi:hypothetical protein